MGNRSLPLMVALLGLLLLPSPATAQDLTDDDDSAGVDRGAIEARALELQGQLDVLQAKLAPDQPGGFWTALPQVSSADLESTLDRMTEEVGASEIDPLVLAQRQTQGIRVTAGVLGDLEARLAAVERQLKVEEDPLRAEELKEQSDELTAELEDRRRDLVELATGLDMDRLDDPNAGMSSFEAELGELLAPLVNELKSATERPRQIEHLNAELEQLRGRATYLTEAVSELRERIADAELPVVKRQLRFTEAYLLRRIAETTGDIDIANTRLAALRSTEGRDILDSTQQIVRSFFARRGRNVFYAFAAFLLTILLGRAFRAVVLGVIGRTRLGPNSSVARVAEMMIYVVSGVLALLAVGGVLFTSGDWVLLSLYAVGLVGVFWGARAALASLAAELRLLMNVGPVRLGERVVLDGVPWRVASLQLVSYLENPSLPGTRLRMPLSSLIEMTSRPCTPEEPWFPSEEGDWVIFEDRAAQVRSQSPEFVTLDLDGSTRTVPTPDWLASTVCNLSSGFKHRVTLLLDHDDLEAALNEAPDAIALAAREAVAAHRASASLVGIAADFDGVGETGLQIELEADFDGTGAPCWEELNEVLQAAVVRCCLERGWRLARPRLSVETASSSSPSRG